MLAPHYSGWAGLTVEEVTRSLTRTYNQLHYFKPELIDSIVCRGISNLRQFDFDDLVKPTVTMVHY